MTKTQRWILWLLLMFAAAVWSQTIYGQETHISTVAETTLEMGVMAKLNVHRGVLQPLRWHAGLSASANAFLVSVLSTEEPSGTFYHAHWSPSVRGRTVAIYTAKLCPWQPLTRMDECLIWALSQWPATPWCVVRQFSMSPPHWRALMNGSNKYFGLAHRLFDGAHYVVVHIGG